MRVVVQNTLTNRQWVAVDSPAGFTVGRDDACAVKLESRFVSGTHLKVERSEAGWEVEVLPNVSPVEVNGTEVKPGTKVQFRDTAVIKIMEFVLTLEEAREAGAGEGVNEQITDLLNVLHSNVLRRLDLRLGAISATDISQNRTDQLNKIIDDLLLTDFRREVFESEMTPVLGRIALRARVNDWLIRKLSREAAVAAEWHGLGANTELEGPVEQAVIRMANKAGIYAGKPIPPNADELVDASFWKNVDGVLAEVLENVRTYLIISHIKKTLYDIIFGLGPLEDLLRSPSITEIMVVNPSEHLHRTRRPRGEDSADVSVGGGVPVDHRADRGPAGPADRPLAAAGGRAPARRQPRQRDHRAAGDQGAVHHHPQIPTIPRRRWTI
jgi:pilus assembly protein CpaF